MANIVKAKPKDLITIKQLPIIEERLKEISDSIQAQVDDALSLAVTEETVRQVKKERTAIRKTFADLEDKRKAVKEAVMAPYNEFEKVYKKYVTDVCQPADAKLKKKIDEVEDGIKKEKEDEVRAYFDEYCLSKDIDFLKFEDAGIKVNLSDSMKSLKDRSKDFVDKVADDLALIEIQEHKAEILVEYKKSLNVSQAITTVKARHEAIEAERKRREVLEAEKAREAEAVAKVEEVVEETVLAPPEEVVIPEASEEKKFITAFKVYGTVAQLKALKDFLEQGGYDYRQLSI